MKYLRRLLLRITKLAELEQAFDELEQALRGR